MLRLNDAATRPVGFMDSITKNRAAKVFAASPCFSVAATSDYLTTMNLRARPCPTAIRSGLAGASKGLTGSSTTRG